MPTDLKLTLNPIRQRESDSDQSDSPFKREDSKNIDDQFIDIQTKIIEAGKAKFVDEGLRNSQGGEVQNAEFFKKFKSGKNQQLLEPEPEHVTSGN